MIIMFLPALIPFISNAEDTSKFFSNIRVSYAMAKGDVDYFKDRLQELSLTYSYNYEICNAFAVGIGVGVTSLLGPIMRLQSELRPEFVLAKNQTTPPDPYTRYDIYPFISVISSFGKGAVCPMFNFNVGYYIKGATVHGRLKGPSFHMDLGAGCRFKTKKFPPVYAMISAQMVEVPYCSATGGYFPSPYPYHTLIKPVEYYLEGYYSLIGVSLSVGIIF